MTNQPEEFKVEPVGMKTNVRTIRMVQREPLKHHIPFIIGCIFAFLVGMWIISLNYPKAETVAMVQIICGVIVGCGMAGDMFWKDMREKARVKQ